MVVPTGDIIDETIGREIVDALERNANVDVDMVDVKVENGTVTLAGMVPNWRARRSAYEAALFTRGVINIRDNLVVSAVA
jgi:osmotically-inducible protein OsmY